ncbi:MAG: InlB B-repeat-containing protein [bacterium]
MTNIKEITALMFFGILILAGCNNSVLNNNETTITNAATYYTVHYNGNGNTGGSVPVDSNNYNDGATVTVKPLADLVHTGYTFANWNTAADGTGISYSPDSTFQIASANVTLYARWTSNITNNTDPVEPDTRIAITITTKNGQDVTLAKAPLLYNKQHVMTIDNDDALNDPYKTFLPLFTGGIPEHDTVASNGMFSTDGCTNDVSYKANTVAWVISSNTGADWFNWSDGSHWLNYSQLDALMANGFGLIDHGYYNDMTKAGIDPVAAVDSFINWSENRYGFRPLMAVAPGGQVFDIPAWTGRWFEKGARFVVIGSGAANAMTRVDNLNINTFTEPLQVGRHNIEGASPATIMAYVNTMIASPGNQWLRIFGHLVNVSDFIKYADIKEFFLEFNALYGKPGNDSIWVANVNDVISYLYCRDTISIDSVKDGNKTTFYINEGAIPSYVANRLITLKITTTDQILDIHVSGDTTASMSNSIVNVLWKKNRAY